MVCDASVVVAALTDDQEGGDWARDLVEGQALAAPHLMPAEVVNTLRRLEVLGMVRPPGAEVAFDALSALPVELYGFAPLSQQIWQLRGALTTYDAWYVALAEALDAPLATLDRGLTRAPGPRCEFVVPDW